MNPIQPKTSRGADVALGLEVAYYTLAVTAFVVGFLATQGRLGHQFQGFAHKAFNSLSQSQWVAVGASAILAPQVLKLAVKVGSATKAFVDRKKEERAEAKSWEPYKELVAERRLVQAYRDFFQNLRS